MHILEIPSFFPPHGGMFCVEQAKALKARGHEVRILSCVQLGCSVDGEFFFTAPYKRRWNDVEGIEIFSSYMRGFPKVVRPNVMRWLNIVESMFDEYVSKYGEPDIIHAHCCKLAGLAAYRIHQRSEIPYFITEHLSAGLFVKDFGRGWTKHIWLRESLRKAYEESNCVIPVSEELVDGLAPFFGRDYRYEVVSNVIDTDFFAFRNRESLRGRPFRYCCLAVADIYGKGFDVLAEAWRDIAGAELHIAGRGTDCQEIRDLFRDARTVKYHGLLTKDGVRDLLYQCDALVLPSRSEAQPLVLFEAMATGIPVVTTECVPDSVRIDGACFVVPVGDAGRLHDMMVKIQTVAPSVSFSMAVHSQTSPKVIAERLDNLFEQYK